MLTHCEEMRARTSTEGEEAVEHMAHRRGKKSPFFYTMNLKDLFRFVMTTMLTTPSFPNFECSPML